ncbi:MAG: EamA family transporter RarD [Terrimesophilobacter sp.]
MSAPSAFAARERSGVAYAVSAYGLWGLFPLYFLLLLPSGPFEIVAYRVLFSFVFCLVIITGLRRWDKVFAIVRQTRLFLTLGVAGVLVFVNWQVYLVAVLAGHVTEAALGYFINPILTVLLGVLLLREKLRRAQWIAVALSGVAVLVLAINYGAFPWIALSLAFSFGLYGYAKKSVGGKVDALTGLTVETGWLVPVAVVELVFVGSTTGITFGNVGVANTLLLLSAGVVTAIPLLLFAASARRLRLTTIGLIQYLTPILQFVIGAFVLHEAMPASRWIGFALVWVALIILSTDMVLSGRAGRARRALPLPG